MASLTDYLGQGIAGLGGIVSNVVGHDVRLGSGGSSLGANVAGQSQPYYSTNTNNQYAAAQQGVPQANPYSQWSPSSNADGTQRQYQTPSGTPISGNPVADPNKYKGYNVGDVVGNVRVVDPGKGIVENIGGNGGGAPSFDQAAYDNQLNASYAGAFQQANDVEAMYRQQYPTSQEFINNSYAEALTPIQNQMQTQLAGLNTQSVKGKQEEKNQIATARQRYNELNQSGLTRFGGSSSTGQAYGELLGRQTSKEMSGINQNFGQFQQDITKEIANVNNFFAEKKSNLEKEKQNKLQELKNSFDDEIRKINSTRSALESEKAAKRMAAIQEFSVQARQAQYDAQVFAQKLDAWKAMKDETIQLAQQFNAKSFSVPGMPGVMGGFSMTGQNDTGNSNYIQGQGSYTPEDLQAMGLSPTQFNTKTGAMTYGTSKDAGTGTYNPDTGQFE